MFPHDPETCTAYTLQLSTLSRRLEEADGEPVHVHEDDGGWQSDWNQEVVILERVRCVAAVEEAPRSDRGGHEVCAAEREEEYAADLAMSRPAVFEVPIAFLDRRRGLLFPHLPHDFVVMLRLGVVSLTARRRRRPRKCRRPNDGWSFASDLMSIRRVPRHAELM